MRFEDGIKQFLGFQMKKLIFLSLSLRCLYTIALLSSISLFGIFGKHFRVKVVALLFFLLDHHHFLTLIIIVHSSFCFLFIFDFNFLIIFKIAGTASLLFGNFGGFLRNATSFISVKICSLNYSGSSSMVIDYFSSGLAHCMIKLQASSTVKFIRSLTDVLHHFCHLLLDKLLLG